MVCRKCGYQNKEGSGFCAGCGSRLVASGESSGWVCQCGYQNIAGSRFCSGCGRGVNGERPNPEHKKKKYPIFIVACVAVALVFLIVLLREDKSQDHISNYSTSDSPTAAETQVTHSHNWVDATCTTPRKCSICGETSGSANGHQWIAATYTSPKTCIICGATEGTKLTPDPIYLNEMGVTGGSYGKVWTRSTENYDGFRHSNEDEPECWNDWGVWGHTSGTVRDNYGNVYTYGIHVDGAESEAYYIGFCLGGIYTTFSGTCACPERSSAISSYVYNTSTKYTKYFEVYGDVKLLYTSATMRYDYAPQKFTIDVTGVKILTIQYPATYGPNEIATLYDAMVS